MATVTTIEWTERTWNPVTGCTKVSQGCKNCYAERIADRFWDRPFTEVRCHPDRLQHPATVRAPTKFFVNSMSDLFHPDVPLEFIRQVFDVMVACRRHTFQVLTKRSKRLLELQAQLPWAPTRAAHRPARGARARRHPLGDRGRRVGPGLAPDRKVLGALDPPAMPCRGRPVLLQAMGRFFEEEDRPRARRPHLRRVPRDPHRHRSCVNLAALT